MRKWGPLLAVCLGTFMLVLDVTITLVALPDIAAQLHTTLSGISWVIDGYALALAAALLAMGTVADRHGLRRIYTLGLAAFTAASLACGLAESAPMLIAMRAVQGLGAAAMFATAISLLRATYSGRDLGAAMGVWAAVAGGAAALGPLIGGALTQAFGWSWIFYVNVPVGVLAIVLTLRVIPRSEVPDSARRERLDLPGAVLFAAFAAGLLYATIAAHEEGWTSPATLIPLVLALAAGPAFVLVQRRSARPLLDLALLARPAFLAALIAIFVGEFTAYGFMAYSSMWLQSITGLTPLAAGLVMLPNAVASMVVSLMSGRILRRFAMRWALPLGLLLVAAGAFAQSGLTPDSTGVHLLAGMLIGGLGMGLVIPLASQEAIEAVPLPRTGMAAGAFTTFQQLGYAFGVAIFGTLLAAVAQSGLAGHVANPHASAQQLAGGGAGQILAQTASSTRDGMDLLLRTTFTNGLNVVAIVGGTIALASAVFCAVLLRPPSTASDIRINQEAAHATDN